MDLAAHRVFVANERRVHLSPTEFRPLRHFLEHPGRVFSRARLWTESGKPDLEIEVRTVGATIRRLRRALNAGGEADLHGRCGPGLLARPGNMRPPRRSRRRRRAGAPACSAPEVAQPQAGRRPVGEQASCRPSRQAKPELSAPRAADRPQKAAVQRLTPRPATPRPGQALSWRSSAPEVRRRPRAPDQGCSSRQAQHANRPPPGEQCRGRPADRPGETQAVSPAHTRPRAISCTLDRQVAAARATPAVKLSSAPGPRSPRPRMLVRRVGQLSDHMPACAPRVISAQLTSSRSQTPAKIRLASDADQAVSVAQQATMRLASTAIQ
ncbi:MAG: winged helix-turn-helix domain-containing protein [Geminicoccaceae bacterium]